MTFNVVSRMIYARNRIWVCHRNGVFIFKTGWWFGTCFSHSVGNVIIPTDELHHFSEGMKPPTRKVLLKLAKIMTINLWVPVKKKSDPVGLRVCQVQISKMMI